VSLPAGLAAGLQLSTLAAVRPRGPEHCGWLKQQPRTQRLLRAKWWAPSRTS